MLADAHNHLQDEALADHLERIAADLAAARVRRVVVNGTHPDDWPRVAALAQRFPWVSPAYGVHPWDCGRLPDDWLARLRQHLADDPFASVGEIGLDRWMLDPARATDPRLAEVIRAPLPTQLDVFERQWACAVEFDRAASVHCLQAWDALLAALRRLPRLRRGFLLHAYSGPAADVAAFAEAGAYFSFNTAFTDPRRNRPREAFRVVPAHRLLVESDAPAMPPAEAAFPLPPGVDGARLNHPANVTQAAADLASLRQVPTDELAAQLSANFERLFGPLRPSPR